MSIRIEIIEFVINYLPFVSNHTQICVDSIRKYTKENTYEIIVVDNNSTDGTREWLKEQKDIVVILNDENVGFPKGCNIGIDASVIDNDILFLNNNYDYFLLLCTLYF